MTVANSIIELWVSIITYRISTIEFWISMITHNYRHIWLSIIRLSISLYKYPQLNYGLIHNRIQQKFLKLFDTSIFICLAQNWLPEIAHYVFASIWNNQKCYGINFKSHWSKFNNKSRPRVEFSSP